MNDLDSRITAAVYEAIDELNLTLAPEKRVRKDLATKLSGPSGALDSLGLVNLVVETEMKVEEAFGVSINLGDGASAAATVDPFQSVHALVSYIREKLPAEASSGG